MSTETSRKIDTRKLDEIIESYGSRKSNLIAILQKVQDEYRYLPEDALIYIGTKWKDFHQLPCMVLLHFMPNFHLTQKVSMKLSL